MSKSIRNCKVGDKVIIGSNLYTITKETKTQFTCLKDGTGGGSKYNFERITREGGRVVGERSWARVLETTPEEFNAAIEAKAAEKKAAADARAQAWNDKVAMVRARNTNIIVTDEGMGGLKKAVMIDSDERPMIVYFDVKPEEYYNSYSQPPVVGVRIRCSTWRNDGWREEVRYGFSQTDARGATVEDALIDLVASHYWN